MPEDQDQGKAYSQDAAYQEVPADGAYDESRIYAKDLDEEAPHRIEAYIKQENIADSQSLGEAASDPEQDQAHKHVP